MKRAPGAHSLRQQLQEAAGIASGKAHASSLSLNCREGDVEAAQVMFGAGAGGTARCNRQAPRGDLGTLKCLAA